MSLRSAILALALVSMVRPHAALADPGTTGALNVPANRIVGLWSTAAMVGPCDGAPVIPVTNTLLFHAGGTLNENIPPTSDRNPGMGTWSYKGNDGWRLRLRFDRFSDGVPTGFTIVDRALSMSADGRELTGPVRATFYATDGSVVQELCGEGTSTRLQ
jgi:hypothetical protein